MRPRLLDLFCGAGGAGKGYADAGFDVIGVDIAPQPHYPYEFHQADAMQVLEAGRVGPHWVGEFEAVHASPPCQGYSRMRHLPWLKGKDYPLLIEPVRQHLERLSVAWVMENVEDAPLQRAQGLFGTHGVLLCGTMFGLGVYRHRPFESSVPIIQPHHPPHREVISAGSMLGDRARTPVRRGITAWQEDGGCGGHMANVDRVREAMGIDWMPGSGLSQAIPPAYTEFIGQQLLNRGKLVGE